MPEAGVLIEGIVIVVWIALILSIGVYSRRFVKGTGEFMVGGRAIPVWMLGFWSAGASVSAWAFFGLPGAIYAAGPWQHWAICIPMMTGFPITVIFLGRWMRIAAKKYNLMTMPDFLGEVYGGRLIRIFAAIGIVIGSVFYATAQFKALGVLLSTILGIDYVSGAAIGIAISVVYIVLGGFIAGAIVNTLNVSMMIIASLIAVGLGYMWTGGFNNMFATIIQSGLVSWANQDLAMGGRAWWLWVSWFLLISSFGLAGQPQIVQKLYGIKKPSTLWAWGLLGAIVFGITCPAYCYLGIVTRYLTVVGQAPNIVAVYGSPDYVIAWLTVYKLGAEAPILGGLLIAGVISAAWSTVDGFVMMGGAAIARDILNKCFRPNWTDKQLLKQLRIWMLIVGIIMVIETMFPAELITWLAAIGWAQFAATLTPALLLATTWKGITKWGGTAGVFVGMFVTAFLTLVYRIPMGTARFIATFYLDAGAWGMILGFITIIIVSLVTKKERGPLYYEIHKVPPPTPQQTQ